MTALTSKTPFAASADSGKAHTHEQNTRVLLIDDDPGFCKVMQEYLASHSFEPTVAATGRSGIEAARAGEFDVVLLDMFLPDINGIEVLKEIRRFSPVSIIILSAHNEETDKIVALGLCQVPEGRLIFPELTVLENLDMGAFMRTDKDGVRRDMEYIFGLFPILAKRRRQAGGTLSGGEQQMLAISRALMARPQLLLLDEPSLGLAPLVIKQIFEIVRKINADGTTVFLVEQNANLALKIAHRGYVMENGRITLTDSGQALLANEDVKKAYLGL